MVYIKRHLEEKIREALGKPEILAIVGPRQAGKTTLLEHIAQGLDEAIFLSFEDKKILQLFMEDEKAFADLYVKNKKYVFIDEFQYAKDGGKKLKYVYDHFKSKIIISGSSAPELTIQGIRHLVGRVFIYNLYPLNFEEFLNHFDPALFKIYIEKKKEIEKYLVEKGDLPKIGSAIIEKINSVYDVYFVFGGYPRVALAESEEEKKTVLKNIYNTYFLREIKDLLSLTTDFGLSKLIKAAALQVGGLVSYNGLSEVSGFQYNDLLRHLNILEKTFICKRVLPFYTNKRTELIKSPKMYFFDNGFRNSVIDDFKQYSSRQDIGQLNENFVFTQFASKDIEVKFWRTKSKAEVDFVIEKERLLGIECKSSFANVTRSLYSFKEKYKTSLVIVTSKSDFEEKNGILYMPLAFIPIKIQ